MKKFFIVLAAVALLAGQSYAAKGTVNGEGEGVVSYQPDCATIPLTISTRANTGKESQEANAQVYAALSGQVVSVLKMNATELKTTSLSTRRATEYDAQTQKSVFVGYVTTHSLVLEVKDIARLGQVYDSLVVDQVDVGDATLTHSQIKTFEKQALAAAVVNARADATIMAGAEGRTVGKAITLGRQSSGGGGMRYEAARAMAKADTVINVGDQSVVVRVSAVFELK